MSFKDSKAQILANSASDDSDISTMEADLATTAVVDDGYVLCTDGRYVIYDEYYDDSNSSFTFVQTLIKCIISSFYMCFVIDYPHNPIRS